MNRRILSLVCNRDQGHGGECGTVHSLSKFREKKSQAARIRKESGDAKVQYGPEWGSSRHLGEREKLERWECPLPRWRDLLPSIFDDNERDEEFAEMVFKTLEGEWCYTE